MIYMLIISVIINVVFAFTTWNLLRKTELYEDEVVRLEEVIGNYYIGTQNILRQMRALDDKEMFEKDDEVGVLFTELTNVLGELRTVTYAKEKEEEQE